MEPEVSALGLGWKSQMLRMNGALVQQESVASLMNGGVQGNMERSALEIQATITAALAQMGIIAQVDVQGTGGVSEIHFHQTL